MADDIITLRYSYVLSMVEHISELEAEIERLRAAGDALQVSLRGRTAEFLADIERLRAEMQQVRLDHITTLGELQEAAAEIEWLKEALTDAQNENRRG